ncbi:uncharacterized protein [Choristoneura fumiferana]|uniref:uncharacterized protein n=1 Tax=Choristoneura fumiferana TaxID=7141 RepID=UPI003D15ED7F
MLHTPPIRRGKKAGDTADEPKAGPSEATRPPNVRKSIENIERATNMRTSPTAPAHRSLPEKPPSPKTPTKTQHQIIGTATITKARRNPLTPTPIRTSNEDSTLYPNRAAEAKSIYRKGLENLARFQNLRKDVRLEIKKALDRLYELTKTEPAPVVRNLEMELARESGKRKVDSTTQTDATQNKADPNRTSAVSPQPPNSNPEHLITAIEKHAQLLLENTNKIKEFQTQLEKQREVTERAPTATYADVAATQKQSRSTLHSVIVTSADETETGEEVLNKVRHAVDAKEGWVRVEKVRKAKDRKVVMGFGTTEERDKVRKRLETKDLIVEDVKNKDPLLVLRSVLALNTDDDIAKALRNQNKDVFRGLDEEDGRMAIKYRRRTRNPHTNHVVMSVSPTIWRRVLETGSVHIDLQRIRVEDQTPLMQCTRCLGYGHGKKFCNESVDLCSHCGGPHLRGECTEFLANVPPNCKNCTRNGLEHAEHNAFSHDCPIRQKWDSIARSTVAYC